MQRVTTESRKKSDSLREIDQGYIHDKSGYSVFCGMNGCGFVIPINGRCPACHAKITRESTHDSSIKLFNAILEENRDVFYNHIFSEKDLNSLKYLINIGRINYFIPFRYLIQLENLERTDRSQLDNFFEYIKTHCKIYKS